MRWLLSDDSIPVIDRLLNDVALTSPEPVWRPSPAPLMLGMIKDQYKLQTGALYPRKLISHVLCVADGGHLRSAL
jgi:hypothetical protein